MEYQDFAIRLDPDTDRAWRVLVQSPAGQASGRLELSLDPLELRRLAEDFEREALGGAAAPPGEAIRSVGERLFAALFSQPIRDRYFQCLGRLEGRDSTGLRIKLQMDLETPGAIQLHALPWEALLSDRGHLGLDRRTVLVRAPDQPFGGDRPVLPRRLRILAVQAQPKDRPALRLDVERDQLLQAFQGREIAEIEVLEPTNLEAIRDALLRGSFHVLHFMGHGDHDPSSGHGRILLRDPEGLARAVTGEALANQLRGLPSLRLVFLNACRTAKAADGGPFADVATALLRAEIPAVLAMQFPISDRAAVAFSDKVYRCLAAGDPIDAAVTEGRLAIQSQDPPSHEWVTPVLFLRASDGRLFEEPELETTAGPSPPPAVIPPPPPRAPWVLAALALVVFVLIGLSGLGLRLFREVEPVLQSLAVPQQGLPRSAVSPLAPPTSSPPEATRPKDSGKPKVTIPSPPKARRPAQPRPFTVAIGQAVWVEACQGNLGVTIPDHPALKGTRLATVTLLQKGGAIPPWLVLTVPETHDFAMGETTVCTVQVLEIDWQREEVRLVVP